MAKLTYEEFSASIPPPSCENCWHATSTNPKCGLCTGPALTDGRYSKYWRRIIVQPAQPKEKS